MVENDRLILCISDSANCVSYGSNAMILLMV